MKNVIVVIGAGSIGQAIARRVSAGRHVLLADLRADNVNTAAKTLEDAGFEVSTANVDVSSPASVRALVEKATGIGEIGGLIHAAGVSASQASPEIILRVDLYGTALVLEEVGNVIARGGAGVVIASQSRGARVNTISPGIIITPLANDELRGPRGAGYRQMIEISAAGRAGTPDEVGTIGALLIS